jgi:hypothetical protein
MRERDEKSGNVGCFILGVTGAMLPMLYVLSLGPAVWLSGRFPGCTKVLAVIYYPLEVIHNKFEPVGEFLDWYVRLWA